MGINTIVFIQLLVVIEFMNFSIEKPSQDFLNHINLTGNDRIIFSGKFGTGKTYFLDKFFTAQPEKFNVIHLYPINYSVASNNDIFELIKYDILFELLTKDLDYEKLNIPYTQTFLEFAKKNGHHFLAAFLNFIPVIGKSFSAVFDKLDSLTEKFLNEHDEQQVDDKEKIIKYLEAFTDTQGCLYEEDFYTILINQLVQQLNEDGNKETILILDDLDRIDPAHLFRIFNVLSAHTDIGSGNKFGFDKVIVVCDINNTRRIFHNKYGSDVDFTGYLDKFYSRKVYEFDNSVGISEQIIDLLGTISQPIKPEHFDFEKTDNVIFKNVAYILTALVLSNNLTVRQLTKIIEQEYNPKEYKIKNIVSREVSNFHIDAVNLIDFLYWIYDDFDDIISSISECKDFETEFFHSGLKKSMSSFLLSLLDYQKHGLRATTEAQSYESELTKQTFNYNAVEMGDWREKIFCRIQSVTENYGMQSEVNDSNIKYFVLLQETLQLCKSEKVLSYN